MPMREVAAYADQLPRVEAIDSLLSVDRFAIGTGSTKKTDRDAAIARWKREAGVRTKRVRDAATLSTLTAGIGLGFRTVKRDR